MPVCAESNVSRDAGYCPVQESIAYLADARLLSS